MVRATEETQFNYPHIFQLPKYTKLLNSGKPVRSGPHQVACLASCPLKSMATEKKTLTRSKNADAKMLKCSYVHRGGKRQAADSEQCVASGKWQMVLMTNEGPASRPVLGYSAIRVFGS